MTDHPVPRSAHPGVDAEFERLELSTLSRWQTALAATAGGAPGWPDISEFNDPPYRPTAVDWDALELAYRQGLIAGVMMRAGFGTVRADRSFARNQAEARKRAIPNIPYWFNYPAYNTAAAEAAMFNATVGPLGPAEAQLADAENDPGALGWPSGAAALAWLTEFLTLLQAPRNATLWYCSTSFVGPFDLASLAQTWGWVEAEYGVAAPDTLGLNPMGWQQTSSATVPGVNGPCDWNQLLRPPLSQWLTPTQEVDMTDAQAAQLQRVFDVLTTIPEGRTGGNVGDLVANVYQQLTSTDGKAQNGAGTVLSVLASGLGAAKAELDTLQAEVAALQAGGVPPATLQPVLDSLAKLGAHLGVGTA